MYPVHFVARKKKLHHLYYSNFMLNALLNTRCNDAQNLVMFIGHFASHNTWQIILKCEFWKKILSAYLYVKIVSVNLSLFRLYVDQSAIQPGHVRLYYIIAKPIHIVYNKVYGHHACEIRFTLVIMWAVYFKVSTKCVKNYKCFINMLSTTVLVMCMCRFPEKRSKNYR